MTEQDSRSENTQARDIAVIGMAGRFPGARNVSEYWENLRGGVESIRTLSDTELVGAGVPLSDLRDPSYVRACPVLADIDKFDASFFGMSPRDASVMDPAHRFFLEVLWEAFENAGCAALPSEGRVGVFAGSGMPLYFMNNLRNNAELMRSMGEFLVRHTGNDMNFLATRASYEFDLRGPSVNVQTACSSALVAVHLARQSLLAGECDVAAVGGATVVVPMGHGYFYKEGEILSPDGHCRPFDEASAGTVFGSGAGCVVLKRLSDALDEGYPILAVIKGSAINNDGALKVGYLAPGVEGQAAAIEAALADAKASADSISYVETHGTGTIVGDPIELTALQQAFGRQTQNKNFCGLGSVKSNIGHLGEAAASAALIKVILSLVHRELPASLGYERPNPRFDFADSAFFVNASLRPWESDTPLRAGITALGAGGTNCHIIVEEAPAALRGEGARERQLFVLSAKSKPALERRMRDLALWIEQNPELDLADTAYTLALGRRGFSHRRSLSCSTRQEALELLRSPDPQRTSAYVAGESESRVVFTFPGGGAQYAGMGLGLYESEPAYRAAADECLAVVDRSLGRDLRSLLFAPRESRAAATEELRRPSLSLPALFTTEYALAKLFESWGVTCSAAIGHSMGEYTAACLAGVISVEDALRLVMLRGRLFEKVPRGGMVGVSLPESETRACMPEGLSIAAVNAPALCVASGPAALIEEFQRTLTERSVDWTSIHIDVAAHSSMLEPILDEFRTFCRSIRFSPPRMPFASNLTGRWITAAEATDPEYWVQHLRNTVRFSDCVETVLAEGERTFLELGPGRTLTTLATAQASRVRSAANSMRHPQEDASDLDYALRALGKVWTFGANVDFTLLYQDQLRNRIALPSYSFEPQAYWVNPSQVREAPSRDLRRRDDIDRWFYGVSWAPAPRAPERATQPHSTLVFVDASGLGDALADRLGGTVVRVRAGAGLRRTAELEWRLAIDGDDSIRRLLEQLDEHNLTPERIVYVCDEPEVRATLLGAPRGAPAVDTLRLEHEFVSLFELGRAAGAILERGELVVVTRGSLDAGDGGTLDLGTVPLRGVVQVVPREFPELVTRLIDLPGSKAPSAWRLPFSGKKPDAKELAASADLLARELASPPRDQLVALRRNERLVQKLVPLPVAEASSPAIWARAGATVLITGGLGGIGLEVAAHLAPRPGMKLALLSRRGLPPEAEWDRLLAEGGDHPQLEKVRRVRELRAAGAQVMIAPADVTRPESLRAALMAIRAELGPLTGVVHAAGVLDDEPMLTRTREALRRVMAPKIHGTVALDELVDEPLDFFVLFSSVASFLGLPGQVDYTAANAFLDAFALDRSRRAEGRTVVVNWNAWQGVGMVEDFVRRGDVARPPEHPSRHPALDGYDERGADRVFSTIFRVEAHWLLSEHKIRGSLPLLPGTGLFELARAAATEGKSDPRIELEHVTFVAPFQVEAGATRRLEIHVTPQGSASEINMSSPGSDGRSVLHFTAVARPLTVAPPPRTDVEALRRRCGETVLHPTGGFLDQPFVDFGPRWGNIVALRYGQGEACIECRLPADFSADLAGFSVHPALLDMALGAAQSLLPGFDPAKHFYVPLAYERARVFRELPAEVVSHVRCLPDSGGELAYFDVSITDTAGEPCLVITRFTMKLVDADDQIVASVPPPSLRPSTGPTTRQHQALLDILSEAITPPEGLLALDRVMTQEGVTQVIVSSLDPNAWREQLAVGSAEESAGEALAPAFARPELASEYEAPVGPVEESLATLWCRLLGVEQIGARDDFFELGGNSLSAVRLFAKIKKEFGVSLPISTLFQANTVRALAAHLHEAGVVTAPGKHDAEAQVRTYRDALERSEPPRAPHFPARASDLTRWGYATRWLASPAPAPERRGSRAWLVFLDDAGVGEALAGRLRERGDVVVCVREGDGFHRSSDSEYTLASEHGRSGYDRLVADLDERGRWPMAIVHLWTLTADESFRPGSSFFHSTQERGFYSLLFLSQALGERDPACDVTLWLVSNGMHSVNGEPLAHASKATLLGVQSTLEAEFPGFDCRSIDLTLASGHDGVVASLGLARSELETSVENLVGTIEREVSASGGDSVVAYRDGVRYVARLEPAPLPPCGFAEGRLNAAGAYLVTCGDYGLGVRVARALLEHSPVELVLVGAEPDAAIQHVLAQYPERVSFERADVTNLEEVKALLGRARGRRIRGVFHAAGRLELQPVLFKSAASIDAVLAPRIQGTRVLDGVFGGEDGLEFLALLSDLGPDVNPLGRIDAMAAAAFCDAYTLARVASTRSPSVRSVLSWRLPAIGLDGLAATSTAVSDAELADVLGRLLGPQAPACVVVSPVPLPELRAAVAAERAERLLAESPSRVQNGAGDTAPAGSSLATVQSALRRPRLAEAESLRAAGADPLDLAWAFDRIRSRTRAEVPLAELAGVDSVAELDRILNAETTALEAGAAGKFKHLVAMHTGHPSNKTPFFLVAGMFGNVLNLRHLGHLLGADRALYGVQARGLYGDEPPHETIGEMAEDYLREIRRVQPRGPYALGGFSGGGFTALEMAQRLSAEGEVVGLLVMLDTPVPIADPLTPHDRAMIQWILLQQKGAAYFGEWAKNRVKWEVSKVTKRFRKLDEEYSPDQYKNDAIGEAFQRAVDRYDIRPYSGTLTLFRPKLDKSFPISATRFLNHERRPVFEDNGWSPYMRVDVNEVPGDHDSMVLEPGVRVLAARLKQHLERVDALARASALAGELVDQT